MIDPHLCDHDRHEPVDVRDHATGGTTTVARICVDCLTQLHPGWGCTACAWNTVETRRFCDPHPTQHHYLARPCKEHA